MNTAVERRVDLIFVVSRIMVLPQTVMNTIGTHLDEHEEIPILFCNPFFDQLKSLPGLGINLSQQVLFIISTKIGHVHQIISDGYFNLLHDTSKISVRLIRLLR